MLPKVEALLVRACLTRKAVVVSLVDVDHFKTVNDTRGHAAGDDVLTTVAEAIARQVPDDAVVARLGGEEFLVLRVAATLTGLEEHILEAVRSSCDVTVSIGVAQADVRPASADTGGDVETTLDRLTYAADRALYTAKTSGRDRVAFALEDPVEWPLGGFSSRRDRLEVLRRGAS